MGIGGEESKHEVANRPRQQQPLTREQVLQHLSTLQKRMGQMQSFAKGLSDQAQQDKVKIQTLEQQLEAAKTLQWAKQRTSPQISPKNSGEMDTIGELPQLATTTSQKPRQPAHLPPISTPRLEEIRKFRQEREEKLRHQFSRSSSDDLDLMAKAIEADHKLGEKLHALQKKCEALENANSDLQAENTNTLLEYTEGLAEKQAVINKYEKEIKALEELIEESYHERETLERKFKKTTNKTSSLEYQIERMEAASKELKSRDEDNTMLLIQAHATEDFLRECLVDDSLDALVEYEEQEDMIHQLESIIEGLEHQLEKASRQQPIQASFGHQMQKERQWGKNVLGLNHKVETLKKQLKDQESNFHNETIEMELELMDAQEFGRMQLDMMDAQEMELLLLSNALADLQKDHPMARSVSGGDLFAIHEEVPEADRSLDDGEDTPKEQPQTSAQQYILPPPPMNDGESSPQTMTREQAKEAEKLKKEKEEKEFQERVKKAHLLTLHKNIYSLSRKFEWQLQRREELEATVEKMNKQFDALNAKYTKSEEELKKLKAGQRDQASESIPAGQEDDAELTVSKDSLSRQLMRATMSIRSLQKELKTSNERTAQLEKELQKKAPKEEGNQSDSVAQLKAQLREQTEANELLKEFMGDLRESYESDKDVWNSQQRQMKKKIEQLRAELDQKNHGDGDSESNDLLKDFMGDLKLSYERDREDWNLRERELKAKIEQLRMELDRKSRGDEDSENNDLLKDFMGDLKMSYEHDREEWHSQQEELNNKIEQLTMELEQRGGGIRDSSAPATTPAKSAQGTSLLIASPPKTPFRTEWMTEISVVRSEISRLKRTLKSKQPQNESLLGAMNEGDSHQSEDYIFADRSEDEINNAGIMASTSASEKWYQEVTALKEELNELTLELRKSHHHESRKEVPMPLPVRPGLDDASSVDSSTTGGFENEISLLREEVDRQLEQRKNTVSPFAASSAGSNASPGMKMHPSGSSLVSSLEGDSSFTEFTPYTSEL